MAEQSLAELNSSYAQERATRLDSAITQALAAKNTPEPATPKAGKGKPAPPARPVASTVGSTGYQPATSPASSAQPSQPGTATSSSATGSLASQTTASEESESESSAANSSTEGSSDSENSSGETTDEGAEAEAHSYDRDALEAAAGKRDLRSIERVLGLKEGVLGATNHEFAQLRRRADELDAQAARQAQEHEQHSATLVQRFGAAARSHQLAQKGDIRAYAEHMQQTTGISVDQFIQLYTKNINQVDSRVLELERENQRLRGQGQPQQPTTQEQPQQGVVTNEQAVTKANAYLSEELKASPVLKLRDGLDAVRQKWLAGFDQKTKTFKLSPAQAAQAVVDERRSQREQEQWILEGKGKPPQAARTRTVSRQGSSEAQPRTERKMSREEAIEFHAGRIRREKANEARRAAR